MGKLEFKGPFLGFTFCGKHSSDLNIVRINSGNRGEMPLTPQFADQTVVRVGADGTYYFSTHNDNIIFNVNIAFDEITEVQLRELKDFLDPKNYGYLIFDERPYVKYLAKVQSQPRLSYLAFDKPIFEIEKITTKEELYGPNTQDYVERVYKGEAQLSFICYQSYGKSVYQTIDEYRAQDNGAFEYDQWTEASGILDANNYTLYNNDIKQGEKTLLYNPGDFAAPLDFDFEIISSGSGYIKFSILNEEEMLTGLIIRADSLQSNIVYHFDSEKKLITTGDEIINYIIIAGDFFYVPFARNDKIKLSCEASGVECKISNIKYDYLYR